jgi:hypothetical protein
LGEIQDIYASKTGDVVLEETVENTFFSRIAIHQAIAVVNNEERFCLTSYAKGTIRELKPDTIIEQEERYQGTNYTIQVEDEDTWVDYSIFGF